MLGRARRDPFLLLVAVAVVLRAGMIALLFSTQIQRHGGWYFGNDDQVTYYGFAHALAHGALAPTYGTIGYDLLLLPIAGTTDFVLQALPTVVSVQALLALPAAYLLYRAGLRLLDRRSALAGTALWLALPVLVAPLYVPTRMMPATVWLGFQIHVDYTGALLACALLAVAAGARDDGGIPRGLLLGAICGFALLTKPTNAALIAPVFAALLVWRRFGATIACGLVTAAVFTPQLVYNHRLFGSITSFAYDPSIAARYIPSNPDLAGGTWSLVNIPKAWGRLTLSNVTGPLILLAAAAALVVTWRRFPDARILVVGQALLFAVAVSAYHWSIGPTFLRQLTPCLPALSLAAGAALVGRPRAQPEESAGRAGWRSVATGILAVAAAAGLGAWIAVAPAGAPSIPNAVRARAVVSGPVVQLSWSKPSAPAPLTYMVSRSRIPDLPASTRHRGFQWGIPPAEAQFPVRVGTSTTDRPGPGIWWYRVAVTPHADADAWPPGVPLAYSQPVRVSVLP